MFRTIAEANVEVLDPVKIVEAKARSPHPTPSQIFIGLNIFIFKKVHKNIQTI